MLYAIGSLILEAPLLPESFEPFRIEESDRAADMVLQRSDTSWAHSEFIRKHEQIRGYEIRELTEGSWLYIFPHNEAQLLVSRDYKALSYYIKSGTIELIYELLCVALRCRMITEGILTLHAACVEVDGQAFCLTAPSRVGKSTRARNWIEHVGASWLSGDRPCIDVNTRMVITGPWDGKEQVLHSVRRPLKQICEIRRASFTKVRMLSQKQAKDVLIRQVFVPMWDSELAMRAVLLLQKLLRNLTVVRLFCDRTGQAALEAYELLTGSSDRFLKEEKQMKLKDGFVIRCIADEYMAIPLGDKIQNFSGVVVLNEVSAFILNNMKNSISKEDLLNLLTTEYAVDREKAAGDLDTILEKFEEYGMIEK